MEITSRSNPLIKRYRLLSQDKKARREAKMFVAEGERLTREALSCADAGDLAFYTEKAKQKYPDTVALLKEKFNAAVISEEIAEYISDTKTPQGIFITVRYLDKILNLSTIYNMSRLICLEHLQDSGNIGTVIRTCDALGIDGVIMSPDCADIYAPKTVRSTMGSLFRVPVFVDTPENAAKVLAKAGFTLYAAVLDSTAKPLGNAQFAEKSAVFIGNEGSGLTKDTVNLCGEKIYIPMRSAESLNASVAAAIIAWEMNKYR